jgi:hypothetical protein
LSDDKAVMRWDPYSLTRDAEFDGFWRAHLAKRDRLILLVLGRGFDVRALETATRLKGVGANVAVWLLAYDNGLNDSAKRTALTQANYDGLVALFGAAVITPIDIAIGGTAGETATSRNTKAALEAAGDCLLFDDVIVDISAMPRLVAMTTVAVLLAKLDGVARAGGKSVNLHVTTAESVSADNDAAQGTLQDQVTLVVGFSGQLTSQTTENWPRVWFPVLGERQQARLDLIRDFIDPDEICPVIPFPSRAPRRGDEIIDEHRAILFDEFQIEPANILLACEYNPFEAYKQIFVAMDRYRRALREMGGCKAFVSPISSKLLSIGVLLACYDHRFGDVSGERLDVGIPYVETAVYGDPIQDEQSAYELYSMWIRGEWEEV